MVPQIAVHCPDCNLAINTITGCGCLKLPVTMKFWYHRRDRRRYDFRGVNAPKFMFTKVIDGQTFNLYKLKAGYFIDCVTNVKLSKESGDQGFAELFNLINTAKDTK